MNDPLEDDIDAAPKDKVRKPEPRKWLKKKKMEGTSVN